MPWLSPCSGSAGALFVSVPCCCKPCAFKQCLGIWPRGWDWKDLCVKAREEASPWSALPKWSLSGKAYTSVGMDGTALGMACCHP